MKCEHLDSFNATNSDGCHYVITRIEWLLPEYHPKLKFSFLNYSMAASLLTLVFLRQEVS